MTFDADERSVDDSQPREVYEFTLPTVTYRLASGVRDILVDGVRYKATTLAREAVEVTTAANDVALEVSLLVSHPLAQRYLRNGIPPRRIDVTVRRKQLTSGSVEQVWTGRVQSMAVDGNIAKFLVPSRSADALKRRIPTVTVGRECAHVLYDELCRVSEAAFQISCTVISVNGARVSCTSHVQFGTVDWFKWGRLIHVASGEYASIVEQSGSVLTLDVPLIDMQSGDALLLSAGCSHDVETCKNKFDNVANFGGLPHKPTGNPFLPGRNILSLKQQGDD